MNVADLIAARASATPAQAAIIQGTTCWSYRDLLLRADAVAAYLQPLLHGTSARVALHASNSLEYIALALGILRAGACFIPVPSELAVPERHALLELTAPQLLLSVGERPWLPELGTEASVENLRFSHCTLRHRASFPEDRFDALNPAFIRFSSGTTGRSKGVVLSHESLLARIHSANRRLRITATDRILWTLPMAHHFAVSIVLYLVEGATTVLEESHLAKELLSTARATGATVFYGSPFHLALLAAEDSGQPWPSLRLAVGTAAALTRSTSIAFTSRYGIAPKQGLGIIEAGLPLLNDDPANPESVGRPDDFEICLRDENGAETPCGCMGELYLRGPGLFDAYLLPWQERHEVLENGWFATGDLAEKDAAGFVFLRGRRKSLINFGGMKFFPEEVEAVLNAHPAVKESRVLGEPHERWGSVALAEIVAADPSTPPAFHTLGRYCRERLAAYKVPVRFRFVEHIARTASGKIKRG